MQYYKFNVAMRKYTSPKDLKGVLFEGSPEKSLPKLIKWIKSIEKGKFASLSDQKCFLKDLKIICVGDVISKAMLSYPTLNPYLKYCFIDGETQRGEILNISYLSQFKEITYINPRGMISDEIFQFIRKTKSDDNQYIVKIEGEEDLLVVPAVIETSNCFMVYGQPPITDIEPAIPSGCVGIYNNTEVKEHFKEIFKTFDVIKI